MKRKRYREAHSCSVTLSTVGTHVYLMNDKHDGRGESNPENEAKQLRSGKQKQKQLTSEIYRKAAATPPPKR